MFELAVIIIAIALLPVALGVIVFGFGLIVALLLSPLALILAFIAELFEGIGNLIGGSRGSVLDVDKLSISYRLGRKFRKLYLLCHRKVVI